MGRGERHEQIKKINVNRGTTKKKFNKNQKAMSTMQKSE
jgi:hypothetical protein